MREAVHRRAIQELAAIELRYTIAILIEFDISREAMSSGLTPCIELPHPVAEHLRVETLVYFDACAIAIQFKNAVVHLFLLQLRGKSPPHNASR